MLEFPLVGVDLPSRAASLPPCVPEVTIAVAAPAVFQCANVPVSKPPFSTQLLVTIRCMKAQPPPWLSLAQVDCIAKVPVVSARLLVPPEVPGGFHAQRSAFSSPEKTFVQPNAGN